MGDCGVCIYGDDGVSVDFFHCEIRRAAKDHECCECEATIKKGERYEYASGKCESELWNSKTCLICAEIAEAFSCEGRTYGGIFWEQLEDLYKDMTIGCLDRLTSAAAKQELQRRWMEWKGIAGVTHG